MEADEAKRQYAGRRPRKQGYSETENSSYAGENANVCQISHCTLIPLHESLRYLLVHQR